MRWLQWAAWCMAASVGLMLPAWQWLQQTHLLDKALQIEAAQLAGTLSFLVSRDPDTWQYKLNALKVELNLVHERGVTGAIRLLNERGQELVSVGAWRTSLAHSKREEVMDSGVRVGRIELQADLRPAAVEALKGAAIGIALALLVWWSLARLALGGLRAAVEELQSTRDEAQSANRAKGAFLAAMSHEIRTPMNGVLGMVEVAARTAPLERPPRRSPAADDPRLGASRCCVIIDDILDFSKIEAGRLELDRRTAAGDSDGPRRPLARTTMANRSSCGRGRRG